MGQVTWTSEFPSAIHSDVFTDHMLKDMWVKPFIFHNFAKQKWKLKNLTYFLVYKNIIKKKLYEDHFSRNMGFDTMGEEVKPTPYKWIIQASSHPPYTFS
jgi:hypothetical protein